MASTNILRYLRRKMSGSYEEPVYIGAEQRFVGALRGSNNNNLEEQNLLGLDCITTSEWIGTTLHEYKEFRNSDRTTEYYILDSRSYGAASDVQFISNFIQIATSNMTFDGTAFLIASDDADFIDGNTTLSLFADLKEESDDALLDKDGFRKVKEEVLFYKNKSGTLIEVSTKITKEKEVDGVTTTKSYIESKL